MRPSGSSISNSYWMRYLNSSCVHDHQFQPCPFRRPGALTFSARRNFANRCRTSWMQTKVRYFVRHPDGGGKVSRLARHAMVGELVRALREADSWCGRTQIHKTLYGFQKLFNPDPQLRADYVLYKHGPYSFTLDEDLAEMEFYGGLERQERPPYGPRYAVTTGTDALRDRFGRGVE